MTDSKHLSNREKSNAGTFNHTDELIKKSILIENGNPARYRLQTTTDKLKESKSYRTIIFGEKDPKKPHKILLMVGETGTGKSSLINTVINYTCGVKREDKIWFEITDEQTGRSVHSQTSIINVYGVYLQEASLNLTIIDTPGYGDTRGNNCDEEIGMNLLSLCTSKDGLHEIDAVCLVINSSETRLSDRQKYIFDAIQCLFGKDVEENIVLVFTHSNGFPPKNALRVVKEAEVKCAVDQKNQPIYFLFDNCQLMSCDKDCDLMLEQSWNLSCNGLKGFFKFLENRIQLDITQKVLLKRKELKENICNLQANVKTIEQKQNKLKQTQDSLEKHKTDINFEITVEVSYRVKVDIDPAVASKAMCCSICEENCHYPGCWWVDDLSYCSVMKDNRCTVCTNKCHHSKHVKEDKIYVTKTKKEKRINEDLKKKYEDTIEESLSEINKLKEELQELEKEKLKLVMEAYHCVKNLEMIALNTESLFILQHIDFLIEKMKEINEPEKVQHLEDTKRAGEENGKLAYLSGD